MTYQEFRDALAADAPPAGLSLALQALWWDAKGDWARAHTCAQDQDDAQGAWVHAYLDRVEGDLPNAGYWYRRAGRPQTDMALADEWSAIAAALLA